MRIFFCRLSHAIASGSTRFRPPRALGGHGRFEAALYAGQGARPPGTRAVGRARALGCRPQLANVWQALAPEALADMPLMPWHADYDGAVPLDYRAEELEPLVESLHAGLAAAGVRLLAVRSRGDLRPRV